MHDSFLELKIKLAKQLMLAGYFVARWSSAWMTRLVLARSPARIERMERDMGIRHG